MIQMPLTLTLDQLPIGNLTLPGIGLTLGPTTLDPTTIRGGEKILTSHLHQGGIRKIGWHQDVVSLLSSLIVVIIFCVATNVLWLLEIVS